MKVAKIIPKTIPILILLQEKRKIWCEIGQKTLYLVVLGGYAYTLGGGYYIHLTMQAYIFNSKIAGLFYHNFVYMSREIGNFMQFIDNFERIYTMLAKIRQRRSLISIT